MFRSLLKQHANASNSEFRHRGVEPGRLENFSDAVFALAITLLLISTSAPSDFQQIKQFVWELLPFAATITLIILIWYQHFIFFIRYGLRNGRVVVLNTVFLVIVLFYVYPLRYLAKGILIPIAFLFDIEDLKNRVLPMFQGIHIGELMIVYGLGGFAVFLALALLYGYALKRASDLELSELEIFDTRVSLYRNILLGMVPGCSAILAMIFFNSKWVGSITGLTYMFYPIVMLMFARRMKKKRLLIGNNSSVDAEISSEVLEGDTHL